MSWARRSQSVSGVGVGLTGLRRRRRHRVRDPSVAATSRSGLARRTRQLTSVLKHRVRPHMASRRSSSRRRASTDDAGEAPALTHLQRRVRDRRRRSGLQPGSVTVMPAIAVAGPSIDARCRCRSPKAGRSRW